VRTADWLSRHARSVVLAVVILSIAGVFAALRLPVALFPAIDFPRIAVNIDAPDRSAERMLTEVSIPMEEAVRTVPGVRSLRSKTTRGSAELSVTFDWDHDMVAALLQVQASLSGLAGTLPPGSEVVARRMDPTVFPVLGYSVISDKHTPVELRDLAEHRIRPALSAIAGVAKTNVAGGAREEIRVEIDTASLSSHGLTAQDIATALAGWNIVQANGRIEDRLKLYLVMVATPVTGTQDIENIVVRAGANGLLHLGDVARVVRSETPQWTRVTADGRDAVQVQVYQQPDGNTVQIAAAATLALTKLKDTLPSDIQIACWYDQSQLVESSATGLRDAVAIGAGLAGLVLLLFLRNIRITLIALVTVPGVLASACLILLVLKQSLNIMTLGGMAAAVGLIIDDSIVMIEHIVARVRAAGVRTDAAALRPRTLALSAAGEFTRPLIGASLATIVIHVPPAFLSGVTGEFFKALSLTIAVSLVVSFAVAWAVVPIMAGALLSQRDMRVRDDGPIFRTLTRIYTALLRPVLRLPWLIVLPIAVVLAAGWWAYPKLKTGFMPAIDEGGFVLDYKSPPGTSLSETDRLLRQMEAIIRATPEVQTYSRRTGLQLGGGITEANEGDFFIRLNHGPRREIEEVMADVRSRIEAQVPGIQVEMAQLMEDLIGDLTAVAQPIEIKLYSENQAVLNEIAPRVAEALRKLGASSGIVDINDGRNIAGDALEIHVDRIRAAAEGLDAATVGTTVQQVLSGSVVTQFQVFGEMPKLVGVRLWSPEHKRRIEDDLERIRLTAPDGHTLPLSRVAEVRRITGQPQIQRENLRRMVAVTARTSGTDLGTAIARVKEVLADPALLVPQALGSAGRAPVLYALGGLYQEQRTAFVGLMRVFAAAVVLLLVLLVYWYESLRVALCLIFTSLLALPCVAVGLWLTGIELNISSMMGLAMIAGSVTEAGVFLCSEVLHPIEMNESESGAQMPVELITAATLRRIRPITMTTLAAALAMLPLVIGIGEGAAMLRPLAAAIVAGLVIQLPLVLLVLPALLAVSGAVKPRDSAHRRG